MIASQVARANKLKAAIDYIIMIASQVARANELKAAIKQITYSLMLTFACAVHMVKVTIIYKIIQ